MLVLNMLLKALPHSDTSEALKQYPMRSWQILFASAVLIIYGIKDACEDIKSL